MEVQWLWSGHTLSYRCLMTASIRGWIPRGEVQSSRAAGSQNKGNLRHAIASSHM